MLKLFPTNFNAEYTLRMVYIANSFCRYLHIDKMQIWITLEYFENCLLFVRICYLLVPVYLFIVALYQDFTVYFITVLQHIMEYGLWVFIPIWKIFHGGQVLLMTETGLIDDNYALLWPPDTFLRNVVLSTPHQGMRIILTLVLIWTDCICDCGLNPDSVYILHI